MKVLCRVSIQRPGALLGLKARLMRLTRPDNMTWLDHRRCEVFDWGTRVVQSTGTRLVSAALIAHRLAFAVLVLTMLPYSMRPPFSDIKDFITGKDNASST